MNGWVEPRKTIGAAVVAATGAALTLAAALPLGLFVDGPPAWALVTVLALGAVMTGLATALSLSATRERRYLQERNARLERDLTEAHGAREMEARHHRDLYETTLEGLFTCTPDGRILRANPALARILGHASPAELLTRHPGGWPELLVDPEAHPRFIRALRTGGGTHDMALEARHGQGGTVWLSLSAHLFPDERNPADTGGTGIVRGSVSDITERRRAEAALRQATEQSEFASRAKTEFLANMSHELRTPLNAIIGFSDIIATQGLGPIGNPVYAEYAHDIYDSGRMLLSLINDILDLSKIEAGKRHLNEHLVDVAAVFASCRRMMAERAIRGGVTLSVDLPAPLPRLYADEVAVKQMLSNLLTNAVKFTLKGGSVTLTAWVAGAPWVHGTDWTSGANDWAEAGLVIAVRDTGIGMRPEDIAQALEPFRQIENPLTRSAGGAGLGLPLVRALIELHGGRLDISSTPGVGTEARLLMPAARVLSPTAISPP